MTSTLTQSYLAVLDSEVQALEAYIAHQRGLETHIEDALSRLIEIRSSEHPGRVIISGIGKAGLVGQKIAATMSSTGTPASFMHPVEALHGDLGFVHGHDCAILLSFSGETVELLRFGTQLKYANCNLIGITRSMNNSLGRLVDACIEIGDVSEACFLGLAPSSSTTIMMAIGDALALALAQATGFSADDFGRYHPAGSLGMRFQNVGGLMRTDSRLVTARMDSRVQDVVTQITEGSTAAAVIVDANNDLVGVFTDGDLRRAACSNPNFLDATIGEFCTTPCQSIEQTASVADALALFQNTRTEELPVVDENSTRVVGLLCLKDVPIF